MLSEALRRFFEVEIRNEDQGGVRPATLWSAHESAEQAPDDVMQEWCGSNADKILDEINALIDQRGEDTDLMDLLDDDCESA